MKMTLFDYLDTVTGKKRELNEEELKGYPMYMMNRMVSMLDVFVPVISELNLCKDLPPETHQLFLRTLLPKRKQYFGYIKKAKKNVDDGLKVALMRYFEVGPREAVEYAELLTDKQAKEIKSVFSA